MKVGGRGLRNIYDKVYPALVNDIPAVKAAGVTVETGPVGADQGSQKFGSITLTNWVPVDSREAVRRALVTKLSARSLDDVLDDIGLETEDGSIQSLAYLHDDAIEDYVASDDLDDYEYVASAGLDWLSNRGYDTDALFIVGEPPMQVPGLTITPHCARPCWVASPCSKARKARRSSRSTARPSFAASKARIFPRPCTSCFTSRVGNGSIAPYPSRGAWRDH